MKAVIVGVLALAVLAVAISPPFNKARFSERRRRGALSGGTGGIVAVACADLAGTAKWNNALNTMFGTCADEKKIDFTAGASGADGSWKYNAVAFNNVHGGAQPTTTAIAYADIDLCKVFPQSVCNQAKTTAWPGDNFCGTSTAASKLCCPLAGRSGTDNVKFAGTVAADTITPKALSSGCPSTAKVAGVARSFMPQIDSITDFVAWYKTVASSKDLGPTTAEVPMSEVVPTQDEMFLSKSVKKICATPTAPSGTATAGPTAISRLSICKKGADKSNLYYILDGHHRYSQKALCGAITGCTANAALEPSASNNLANIAVNVFDDSCANIVAKTHGMLDYSAGKNYVDPFTGTSFATATLDTSATPQAGLTEIPKYGSSVSSGLHFAAAAFVELESLFGRSAHESEAKAAEAYVAETRQRLAKAGMSLKGGDEALMEWWKANHAPRLWA